MPVTPTSCPVSSRLSATREQGDDRNDPATVVDYCKLLRCVSALARVVRDGGGGVGSNGGTAAPATLLPQVQQYTTAVGACS